MITPVKLEDLNLRQIKDIVRQNMGLPECISTEQYCELLRYENKDSYLLHLKELIKQTGIKVHYGFPVFKYSA